MTSISSQSESNGTVTHTLHTPRGSIATGTVILATNAYTSALVPSFSDLIVPVRGHMSALLPPRDSTRLPNSYGAVAALGQPRNNDDYLTQRPFDTTPRPGGHLMFGGGRSAAALPSLGMADDSAIDAAVAAYLRRALPQLLELGGAVRPGDALAPAAVWSGIMAYSRDNHPWVGPLPARPGVWLCAGYTGHGMPNATLCARALVHMVLGAERGADLAALQDELVRRGDLPSSYLVSEERIARTRAGPTVEEADRLEMLGGAAGSKL